MRLPLSAAIDRSLSLRLLLFAGGAIALALVLAWVTLGLLFERHSERQLQVELERQGIALIAALRLGADGRPLLQRPLTDPRFERPGSGLYWRASAPAGELRSRSLWDGIIPPPREKEVPGWTAFNAKGPFEPEVLIVARTVRLDPAGPAMLVEVAADRRPVADARAAFGTESAYFLLLLWVALAVAAWIQVRLGLRPLRRIREDLAGMSASVDARLSADRHPVEIQPLTGAINDFAARRAADVAQARERARDLAHALKTPITALRMQIDRLDDSDRREMTHSLSLLSGAVEAELARSGGAIIGATTTPATIVERLLAVISRTPDGARLDLRNDIPPALVLPMSSDAALEAFGALIDNAARHARSAVAITGGEGEGTRWIEIADDGPGIAPELRAAALGRGIRLDERGTRHGLGLSIARDFVEASQGTLTLGTAALGGLSVKLLWPAPES